MTVDSLVLLTGATSNIGRAVFASLTERGYRVRITTRRDPEAVNGLDGAEVRKFDFLSDDGYDDLVAGCDAVVHVAAETVRPEPMQEVNADATRRLAIACEANGVKAFCYKSSVAVYGSGRSRDVREDAPVMTADRDVASEYWDSADRRVYGRTKLAGELAIRQAASSVGYVIMRDTTPVAKDEVLEFASRNKLKRALLAHRHTHHILVEDVAHAFVWAMERILAGRVGGGDVETYNLAEDDHPDPTYAHIMAKAYAASGDARYKNLVAPAAIDWLIHLLKFRGLPLRRAYWQMRYPNDRLRAAGFEFKVGMREAERVALNNIRAD